MENDIGDRHQAIPRHRIAHSLSDLEIKGYMFDADDRVNEKNQAAKKWVAAVNNLGDFGTWDFLICHKVEQLPARLEALAKRKIPVSLKA